MMFGSNEAFTYLECSNCGCLQLVDAPSDTKKSYPSKYHSSKKEKIITAVSRRIDRYGIFKRGSIGSLVRTVKKPESSALLNLMRDAEVKPYSRILDVGCGTGLLLDCLRDSGFTDLTGIEPYQKEYFGSSMKILAMSIEDLADDNGFDVIIFSHSLEHVPNQLATLRKASELLKQNGVCIVAMPVKTEYIWNRYGTNWVQIDAPRHYVIHTLKSFELLLERTDLVIDMTVFDSSIFQFFGSEQYVRGIPLRSQESYSENPEKSIFNAKQISEFERMSKQLNAAGQGDQAIFCLRKKDRAP